MVDIPGNSSTNRTISVGGSLSDALEVMGDHDWIRIQLTAGQSISVLVDGLTLEDPYLRIRDANGNVIYENDDITPGEVRDSLLAFTATYTGTYFIDVGAWVPDPGEEPPGYTGTGTYTVSVTPYTPPPLGTVQQLADYLVSGHWNGEQRHFNVTPGGSITVNLTALTAPAQTLAIAALAAWTDIIGIQFVQVSSGGQITFDDNQEGAFSTSMRSNGIIISSHVNVSVGWLADNGTSLNGYSFQTYIHEIGHALGLGHQGGYNGEARYPYDAEYQNDGWPMSVMSYFDQRDNTYFSGQGFNFNFITTPMMADILAMSMLYGLSSTTRAGDTIYGPGWTSSMGALCIFDSGGNDTIDLSGLGGNHRIDLNPGTFSNVLGEIGNVSIALGVIIENARGSSGNDTLIGNSAANVLSGGGGLDTLIGGVGNDTFRDTAAGLNGDTITDFAVGDRIVITDANLAAFSFNLSGNTLFYGGGSLTLQGVTGQLVARAAEGGGVELLLSTSVNSSSASAGRAGDFNGDGRDDILWRHESGQVVNWLGQANGGFISNANANAGTDWHIAGVGDFNGDGRDDVLWRNDNGDVTDWLGQSNGSFASNFANAYYQVANSWQIAGTGDFNGDGRDDILWRHESGQVVNWLGQANGGFVSNANANAGTDWHIAGTGDFNGDGRDDVLWRNDNGDVTDWLGQSNGSFASNFANAYYQVANSWHVQPATEYLF